MKLTTDWHIHSGFSCDCRGDDRSLTMDEIVTGAAAQGIVEFGVADHFHSRFNLGDIEASAAAFASCEDKPAGFHFGVEATCMRKWELEQIALAADDGRSDLAWGLGETGPADDYAIDLSADDARRLGIEYVIGSAHWSRGVYKSRQAIIDDHVRQYLFLIAHPLVDILGHPWWWASGFQDERGGYSTLPWFDDFGVIPQSIHDELAAAMVQYNVAAEINPGTVVTWHYPEAWRQRFAEYLAWLAERGVKLAPGSDRHLRPYHTRYDEMEPLLESVGITERCLWRLR